MSWRFRKAFKVLPGVKLNLTAHGLSATFGAAPFSINVGPRGVYRNVSIPGTGIWDRQRIGGPSSRPSGIQPPTTDCASPTIPSAPPSVPDPPSPASAIHSASTELLTSESLQHLRRLLADAYNERDEITKELSSATLESDAAARRYQKWEHGFLIKRLLKQSFTTRKEAADTAAAKLEELQEQLRLTTIATEITLDPEQAEPYHRMRDDFAAVSECQKVWNVLTEKAINRIAERSTANTAVTRNPVSFSLDSCDLIQWEKKVPHLQNRTGGDMYVYPGFILYRASKQAFALIDFRDVSLTFVSAQFTEADAVPSDTKVVGHTWAKVNKDGTPDRRFANNCQIPIVHYGSLLFSSPDGLDVRYLCSNAALAERFAKSWAAFRTSFIGPEGDEAQGASPGRNIKDPFERLNLSLAVLRAAQDTFTKNVTSSATSGEKRLLRKEHLVVYMAAVAVFIDATKEYLENSSSPRTAKARLRRAVQAVEAAHTHLEECVRQEQMDATGSFVAYFDAIAVLFAALPCS